MDSPRRLSTASSSGENTPILSNFNSSTSLILVHDDEEPSSPVRVQPIFFPEVSACSYNCSIGFPDDEDEEDIPNSPDFEIRRPFCPPMAPSLVFLYLLSPYLKLGALFLPNSQLPLKYGLPPLIIFSVLSAFARQIWYMMARYTRKADLEDIILDTFARGRGKERQRAWLRTVVRGGTGTLRVLLAFIYLRESVHIILPLLPEDLEFPPRPVLTVLFALALLPLVSAPSLASKRIVYATWASIATYIIWFICVTVAHAQGTLEINPGWLRMGTFWQGINMQLRRHSPSLPPPHSPLYASLKAGSSHGGLSKSVAHSFRTLSTISVAVAVAFTLPLIFYTAHMKSVIVRIFIRLQLRCSTHSTLLLAIPSVLITTPSLPLSERIRRATSAIPLSTYLVLTLVAGLSLVPTRVARVLSDALLVCACGGTFFLPALVHITSHFFKRPLAIVVPAGRSEMPMAPPTPSGEPSTSSTDELLQRKERALQRTQWRKRVVWDIGVWVLLLPVGGGGVVWGIGRLAGKW
ncbi:hypothetical protein MSAN_01888100 [Mycena sanguinolenta]|uniref:Uncharacterized protein n=1 Tax=Mycena sanguinolenta TaxID=230812 RepID=A0A8H7CQL5_9AGAR|nr:hypothetical protein MSAN_01888100 [Mycena sanguinolenta]